MSRLRFGLVPLVAILAAWLITACDSADPVIPTINTPPVAQAGGPYTGVVGQATPLDGTGSSDQEGPIASYLWSVEDGGPTELAGSGPLYRCSAAGTFTLTLTVRDSNGAQDSDTGEIACRVLNSPPTADPGGPYVARIGENATLDGSASGDADGTIVSWVWTIDDGIPTVLDGETVVYACTDRGEYGVELTVTDDGGGTATRATTLECVQNVPPTAVTGGPFSVRIGAQAFLDARNSIDPDGSIVSYRWQIDDGGPTVFNRSTAFYRCTSAATYPVTLVVTDDEGATGTEATTLDCVANVAPVADPGGPYSVDLGTDAPLDGSGSTDPDGDIVSWVWSIADPGSPTVLTGETPSYPCNSAGTFPVTLTVADNEGATSTGTTSVTCVPNQPPTAATGGPYAIREGGTGTLDGRGSTDVDGTIVSYAWSLDGAPPFSSEALTEYTCTAAGSFDLTLTVTDDDGDSGSATTTLQCVGNVGPTAAPGGPYSARIGAAATLDGSGSEDPDGSIATWRWTIADSGEPTVLEGETVPYTCTDPGTHEVVLTVSDNDGATDSDATTVACQANALPTADAGPAYTGNVGESVAFDGSGSSDPDGTITAWRWTVADPDSPTLLFEERPSYPCTVAGTFDVTLVVTDNDGEDSAPSETTVTCVAPNRAPTADAGGPYAPALVGAAIPLDGSASLDPDGDPLTFTWSIDDGVPTELAGVGPDYTCTVAGTFGVSLTVSDGDLSDVDDSVSITCEEPPPANQAPIADAGGPYAPALVGAAILLDGSASLDPDGDPLTFAWSIDDGIPTELAGVGPDYTCTVAGTFGVSLTVSDGDLSDVDDSVSITCEEPPPAPTNVSVSFSGVEGGSLPDRVEEESALAYRVRVQNTSSVAAEDVVLAVTIDPDAEAVEASDLVASGNVWSGVRSTIAPGEVWDVVFRMIVEEEDDSPHVSQAAVVAPGDTNEDDDRAGIRILVVEDDA